MATEAVAQKPAKESYASTFKINRISMCKGESKKTILHHIRECGLHYTVDELTSILKLIQDCFLICSNATVSLHICSMMNNHLNKKFDMHMDDDFGEKYTKCIIIEINLHSNESDLFSECDIFIIFPEFAVRNSGCLCYRIAYTISISRVDEEGDETDTFTQNSGKLTTFYAIKKSLKKQLIEITELFKNSSMLLPYYLSKSSTEEEDIIRKLKDRRNVFEVVD